MTTDKYSLHWNLARDSVVYLPLPITSAILLGESSGNSPCDFETSLRRYISFLEKPNGLSRYFHVIFICFYSTFFQATVGPAVL